MLSKWYGSGCYRAVVGTFQPYLQGRGAEEYEVQRPMIGTHSGEAFRPQGGT